MLLIGQVSQMFGLPVPTLRYYDKQGVFPQMERVSAIRKFGDNEAEALRVIERLKKAGRFGAPNSLWIGAWRTFRPIRSARHCLKRRGRMWRRRSCG